MEFLHIPITPPPFFYIGVTDRNANRGQTSKYMIQALGEQNRKRTQEVCPHQKGVTAPQLHLIPPKQDPSLLVIEFHMF